MSRRRAAFESLPVLRRFLPRFARCVGALNRSPQPPARATRPMAVGEPLQVVASQVGSHASTSASNELGREVERASCASNESSAKTQLQCKGRRSRSSLCKGGPVRFVRPARALGVPACAGSAVRRVSRLVTNAGFHRLKGVVVPSNPRPNPSIEGTSNIWLRQLSAAPHIKR